LRIGRRLHVLQTSFVTSCSKEFFRGLSIYVVTPNAQRVLVADAILSAAATLPGFSHPQNNYTSIAGGFVQKGASYPQTSPHLNGSLPAGHNLGFKDGHVEWHPFDGTVVPRNSSAPYFWW
jgi:hypothetical protein